MGEITESEWSMQNEPLLRRQKRDAVKDGQSIASLLLATTPNPDAARLLAINEIRGRPGAAQLQLHHPSQPLPPRPRSLDHFHTQHGFYTTAHIFPEHYYYRFCALGTRAVYENWIPKKEE